MLVYLEVSTIILDPDLVATRKGHSITALRRSIKRDGLLLPIDVTQTGEDYTLVCGYSRLQVFLDLGWKMIPANVITTDDMLRTALANNLVRI